jgi:predicted GH43/DUF377 family glycosyl hydrolase
MLKRFPGNPILTRGDIPPGSPPLVDVSSVFNPGATAFNGGYLLLLRVQNRGRETFWVPARGTDGESFTVTGPAVQLRGLEKIRETVYHAYDPRITFCEGVFYIMFALDLDAGCVLGLARTDDFAGYDFLGIVSDHEVRNGVLFPEKVGGRYLRLERPNLTRLPGGATSGSEIWLAESDDLIRWKRVAPVMSGRPHYWDELIGSGPPPIRTSEGWLHIYHGVATHFAAANIYQAGVVLLDLDDPSRVLARSRYNILEPREPYELTGQVPNVVFPSGLVVDPRGSGRSAAPNDRVFVYYGAADTVVGLATSTVGELIDACREGS